jgi:hypothetical protein
VGVRRIEIISLPFGYAPAGQTWAMPLPVS